MNSRIVKYGKFVLSGAWLLVACNKVDNFKNTLDALPQISNMAQYAYKASYTVGDTMTITGSLKPNNDLRIHIGNADAVVVAADTIHYRPNPGRLDQKVMDQIKVLITEQMGSGANIPVTVTSGGYSTNGASISIYSAFGPGSFKSALKLVDHAALSDPYAVFLNCVNGKGDIYYYETTTGNLQHVKKDGSTEILLTAAQLTDNNQYTITSFTCGGVNPQGTKAWMSVESDEGYTFLEANLTNKSIRLLNQTAAYKAPFSGKINEINLQVTAGIFADSVDNVYIVTPGLLYGWLYQPVGSIAQYNSNTGNLRYVFRSDASPAEITGATFEGALITIQPNEKIVYVPQSIAASGTTGAKLYDLTTGISLKTSLVSPAPYGVFPNNYIGPFNNIRINLNSYGAVPVPDRIFGFLPLPGKRIASLLYQHMEGADPVTGMPVDITAQLGGPKWMVFDFSDERTYQYAPDRAEMPGYSFEPISYQGKPASIFKDEIINYDEDGNLFMTANGRKKIVRTAPVK